MAKKISRQKELKKAQKLLGRQPRYSEVVKQAIEAAKGSQVSSEQSGKRIRMPYVSATPLSSTSWS